ncbi:Ger(x)C family spore germination protein (plasmid) [Bacillus sp. N447-1]|uniref:Ger(x)C family spore germination protein n=1 Tax=Bacillus sp. N447-1 TaxID=2789208 RepID=UPI001F62335B|nr:Ger(x)C family spore germination protein [Bacillus sp. N447-1]UNT71699.1 Ger(x)C family spore germination protein [Bacillus sp. N447-1]
MRIRIFLILLFWMMPFLSGCWSRVEINDLAFVTATGIDKMEDGKIRVALQIAIPRMLGAPGQGGSGGEKGIGTKAVWVVSEKGTTIMDAYRKLQEKLPREITLSHNRIIIIGEKMARSGVSSILDFFTRNREARMRSYIVFTKSEALTHLKFIPKFEKIPAEVLREEEEKQISLKINLRDFAQMLVAEGVEPIAAEVKIVPSNVINKEASQNQESKSSVETNESIKGTAVFKKDKLIGWLNNSETREILWLLNKMKADVITINIPKEKGNGKVSVQTFKVETKFIPILKQGKLNIGVQVKVNATLYEDNSKMDLSNPNNVLFLEKKLKEKIEERIQAILDKAQNKFKSDILGFGTAVQRKYPKEWENKFKERWHQEFPKLKVKINTNVTVDRTGLTKKSLMREEKEFQKR